ncbi:hypothetical protein [Mycobacteroides saopaulense]|uniref:Uncharacterized protein n=1 Tax=Mycobacteroides saopaulense TaxID=1578165 RepID=A0ABX3C6R3_9MYCO|nr:hypothetical protein [Mycobacteroides saopaulense]OHT89424.1 hypothetical protein BKG68_05295 [Mycobacteroides saopaulense]OHU14263.1 hypothetical protein BKG73_05305 [Mycobacteroides saopaulense]
MVAAACGAISVAAAGPAMADEGDPPAAPAPAPAAPQSPVANLLPGGAQAAVVPSVAGDALSAGLPAPVAGLGAPGGPLSAEGPLLSPTGPLSANGPLTAAGGPLSADGPVLSPTSPVSPVNEICGSGGLLRSVTDRFAGVIPESTLASMQNQHPVGTDKCPASPSADDRAPAVDQPGD